MPARLTAVSAIQHIASTFLRGWLPPLVLVWGSVALGLCVLPRRIRVLPSPWPVCIAAALGSQLVGLGSLVLATRGLVSPLALAILLIAPLLCCCGLAVTRRGADQVRSSVRVWWDLPPPYRIMLAMCAACYALMAVIASTPPSKHDDLWYHLVLAKRTVVEGVMRFHPSPFLLTAPQHSYSSSLVPLLTFGKPSAALALGVLWSLVFVWCFWERASRRSAKRAAIGTTILVCAFGNFVWWTSASSTVLAAFVSTFLLLWIVERESLRSGLRIAEYFGVLGTLSAALCVTKISFLPPVALLLGAAWYEELRSEPSLRTLLTAALWTGLPLVLLYAPWLWWSYSASGNPFGIALLSVFGSTVFDPSRLQAFLESARRATQLHAPREVLSVVLQTHLLHLAFVFVAGVLVFIRTRRWAVLFAALAGSVILALSVTHDLRFHSIVVYGFLLVAVIWYEPPRSIAVTRLLPSIVAGLTVPTLAAGAYYGASFMRNAAGLQTDAEFLTRYTGMYPVVEWCNANLPPAAGVCLDVHALPRLFHFDRLALSPEHLTTQEVADRFDLPAYMVRNGLSYLVSTNGDRAAGGRFVLTKRFDNCILEGLRSPGATPAVGTVYVYRLAADGGFDSK